MKPLKIASIILLVAGGIGGLGWLYWLAQQPPEAWVTAERLNTVESYSAFLASGPKDGKLVQIARNRIHQLAWQQAKAADTVEAYRTHIERYPKSPNGILARGKIRDLELAAAQATGMRAALDAFIEKYPNSGDAREARLFLARLGVDEAIDHVDAFVERVPRAAPNKFSCRKKNDGQNHHLWRKEQVKQLRSIRTALVGAQRKLKRATRALLKGHSDIKRLRAENDAWNERVEQAKARLGDLLDMPAIAGGLSSRRLGFIYMQRLAISEADPAMRARLAEQVACAIRRTADGDRLRAYAETFPDNPHKTYIEAAIASLRPRTLDVLLRDGMVSAEPAKGEPGSSGVSIQNKTAYPIGITIQPGLVLGAGMLVVGGRDVRLKPEEQGFVGGIPSVVGGFTRTKRVGKEKDIWLLSEKDALHPYLSVLGGLSAASRHAAAWIIGRNATYEEMWRLRLKPRYGLKAALGKRAITEKSVESALAALKNAGYDVAAKAICKDRRWRACQP